MEPALVRPLLRALRKARGGSLDLDEAPPAVAAAVGGGLAGACRALALWADTEVADPRAADAFIRTYGLGRMPETRAAIARSLRTATGRRGLSPATVDDLVRAAEAQLARQVDRVRFPGPWGPPTPVSWVDPFPGAASCSVARRRLQQVLYAAWADIPDEPVHGCRAALLLYEQEHGLRGGEVGPLHREQRRRLRRLAWSMLTVALERNVGKEPDDVVVDLLLGPRRIAVVERLPHEAAALLAGVGRPTPDAIEQALRHVRRAVRQGRPESPELLGLLREAVARHPDLRVTAHVTAGIAALATIVARELRQVSGVLAASEVILLAGESAERLVRLPARDQDGRQRHTGTLHDGLRAAQELAELHDVLGHTGGAAAALRAMARLLRHLDPKDPSEVRGWLQQHLQTRSTVARHRAQSGRRADLWQQQAERDAQRSLELAEAEQLPLGFRLVPASQLLATAIAGMRIHRTDAPERARWERLARSRLAAATAGADAVGGAVDRPTHSARLSVARRWWELALLCGDPEEIVDARSSAQGLVGARTLPHDLQKLDRLEAQTRARGVAGDVILRPPAAVAG